MLEREPGLEVSGAGEGTPRQEVPNSPWSDAAAAAASSDPCGQKTAPVGVASPGRRSHVGVPRSGSATGGDDDCPLW